MAPRDGTMISASPSITSLSPTRHRVCSANRFRFDISSAAPPRQPVGRIFRQGMITNLLNPKMALFVLAQFPQFVQPEAGPVAIQILVLAAMLNLIGLVVNGAVILAARRLGHDLARRQRWPRLPQYLMATVFFGLACRLVLADRRQAIRGWSATVINHRRGADTSTSTRPVSAVARQQVGSGAQSELEGRVYLSEDHGHGRTLTWRR